MAVVNTKATAVTNADASQQSLTSSLTAGGRLRENVGTLEAVSGDSIGSTYRLARVYSGWRVSDVKLYCDAITTCAGDVGLYDINANGGAVVDVDFFGSAVSLASALTGTSVMYEAATGPADVSKIEQALWQKLGLSADPKKWYDVAVTLTAAAGSAGTVSLAVYYVDGN